MENLINSKFHRSEELYKQAKKLFPCGTQLFSHRPELGAYGQLPIYFDRMKGSHY